MKNGGTKAKTVKTCGARTRSGRPCANRPLKGKRRCRMHGGKSGRKPIHGRYSGRLRQLSEEEVEAIRERARNPGLLDQARSVVILQLALEQMIAIVGDHDDPELLARGWTQVAAVAERLGKRQQAAWAALRADDMMRDEVIPAFLRVMREVQIIVQKYLNRQEMERFNDDLARMFEEAIGGAALAVGTQPIDLRPHGGPRRMLFEGYDPQRR